MKWGLRGLRSCRRWWRAVRVGGIVISSIGRHGVFGQSVVVVEAEGRKWEGRFVEATTGFVVLEAAGRVERLDRGLVVLVRFGSLPEMERADDGDRRVRLDALRRVWFRLRPTVDLAESEAGHWGLRFAREALDSGIPDNVALAFSVFRTVEMRDWSRTRRLAARRGRFQALLEQGKKEEALREARSLANEGGDHDPELLLLAKMVLGDAAAKAMAELEREHPRWMDDDEVLPQRQRLFDEAAACYLHAHLHHGDRPEDAAAGLGAFAALLERCGEAEAAAARRADLEHLYPGTGGPGETPAIPRSRSANGL